VKVKLEKTQVGGFAQRARDSAGAALSEPRAVATGHEFNDLWSNSFNQRADFGLSFWPVATALGLIRSGVETTFSGKTQVVYEVSQVLAY